MTKDVWVSTLARGGLSLSRFSFWRKKDRNSDPAIKAKSIELTKLYRRTAFGLPFDAREIRTRMTWDPWDNKKFKGLLPASFQLFPLLRADVAEVFRRHDLGDAILLPLELFEKDDTTQMDGMLYALVPGTYHTTLDYTSPWLSSIAYVEPPRYQLPRSSVELAKVSVIDRPAAPIDLWYDVPATQCFFLSGALAQDLNDAGFGKALRLSQLRSNF